MDFQVIFKIQFEGKTKILPVSQITTLQQIGEEINRSWPEYISGIFSITYSVGCLKDCCLESESDLLGLIEFCKLFSEKLVEISLNKSIAKIDPTLNKTIPNTDSSNAELHSVSVNVVSSVDDINAESQSMGNSFNAGTNKEIPHPTSQNPVSSEFNGVCSIPQFDICPREKNKTYLSDHWSKLMEIGAVFAGGAPEFRVELVKYSTKLNFKYIYKKNCPRYVYAVCSKKSEVNCQWYIKAKKSPMNSGFMVHKANLIHTCVGNLLIEENTRFGPKILKDLVLQGVKSNPNLSGKKVVDNISVDYGIKIPYYKAWRGIEAARDDIFGSYDDSYDQLRWYSLAVKKTNPGSICEYETDSNTNNFERLFVSFYACMEGFKHCRPMLFIDGTFLKGRSKGVLLAATAKDGDNGLFPVAFAVVSAENRSNWTWFLSKIKDNIYHGKQIIFISDRNPGLMSAFYDVWQHPPHFYCLFHLIMNLKAKYGSGWNTQHRENMADLFRQCAYAPNTRIFNEKLKKYKEVGGRIAEKFIEDMPFSHWAVSHSPGIKRYGEMTSNAAESFNSWIREARSLPITHMIDEIRSKLSRWFVERRNISSSWSGLLVPTKEILWNELANISAGWSVSIYPNGQFQVDSKIRVTVDLEHKTCSCFQWQITGFPCSHAIAVIKRYCETVEDVIEDCFMASNYRECYKIDLMPVPDTEKYECIQESETDKILPPILNKPPGRPKQKRITSYGEFRRVKPSYCSICGKKGRHDPLTCAEVFGTDCNN